MVEATEPVPGKRRWNLSIWAGFLVTVAGFVAYPAFFVWIPVTRDIPWVSLLLFVAGLALIARGSVRAWRRPALYRGKVAGPVVGALSLAIAGLFTWGLVVMARQLPASAGAPQVGQQAPDIALSDSEGRQATLAALLAEGARGAVVIFYRGHW